MSIKIGIVDDHQLFLKSLISLLETYPNFQIVVEALNGKDLQSKMDAKITVPDIILIDVNMPVMDGIETTMWLQQNHPVVKPVALSMKDDDRTVIKMIKAGCCAYILKDTHPDELERAINEIYTKGCYNADIINVNFRRLLIADKENESLKLSEKEIQFLKYACSDMTYKEIAGKMNLSERTVDGYRETLFQKLKVQSRVGMCLEAIKREFVSYK